MEFHSYCKIENIIMKKRLSKIFQTASFYLIEVCKNYFFFFVFTTTTPFFPLSPYFSVADFPFNTLTDSIVSGSNFVNFSFETSFPSTIKSGLSFPFEELKTILVSLSFTTLNFLFSLLYLLYYSLFIALTHFLVKHFGAAQPSVNKLQKEN